MWFSLGCFEIINLFLTVSKFFLLLQNQTWNQDFKESLVCSCTQQQGLYWRIFFFFFGDFVVKDNIITHYNGFDLLH